MLRNGGLWVSVDVRDNWQKINKRPNQPGVDSGYRVEVVSGIEKPIITSVTSYGYEDNKNEQPSTRVKDLLGDLGLPTIHDRSNLAFPSNIMPPLTQPAFHPYVDTYLMNQLTRILQGKAPVDNTPYSWLEGELSSDRVPAGCWGPVRGQVLLRWGGAGVVGDGLGVRPSGRGNV